MASQINYLHANLILGLASEKPNTRHAAIPGHPGSSVDKKRWRVFCHMLVMLKILQARLQQYVNRELPDVQGGFRKDRGTRDQIAKSSGSSKSQESSRKTSISALLTMPKPLTVWITIHRGKL